MRPGLLCPGRAAQAAQAARREGLASMRPGLLCPGRNNILGALEDNIQGFNEAGAVMPRKARSLCIGGGRGRRFNEAGAVMPRKGPLRSAGVSRSAGFNEAGAVMPRKDGGSL